jgi:hypothetical protein
MKSALIIATYYVGMILVSALTLSILEKSFVMYDKYKSKKAES